MNRAGRAASAMARATVACATNRFPEVPFLVDVGADVGVDVEVFLLDELDKVDEVV
jgi:hypothetical protein